MVKYFTVLKKMKIKDIIHPKTISGTALLIVILTIGVMAIIFTLFLTYNMQNQNNEAIKKTEQRYTQFYKRIISNDVNYVYSFIRDKQSSTEKKVKANIKDHVLNAFSIANHIYSMNKDVNQSQVMLEIKEALRPIHWGNNEFLFIIDNNGSFILNTDKPELETLFSADHIQLNENLKMVQIAKTQDLGFFKYKGKNRVNSLADSLQIAFVKKFEPFHWTIGVSIYLSDIERNIKNEVLNRIADMDNGEDQYIFVIQGNGFCLYHPLEEFHRKFILDYTANNGKKVIANLIDTAKHNKNNGYYYYSWKKPSSGKIAHKMSFVKHVKNWDWTIGTGVYLKEMEEAIDIENKSYEKELKKNITAIFLTSLLAISFSLLVGLIMTRRFKESINTFINFFKEAANSDSTIKMGELKFEEFKFIGSLTNQLLIDRMQKEIALDRLLRNCNYLK